MRALLVLLLAGSTRAVFDFGETWGKFAEQVQETTDKIKEKADKIDWDEIEAKAKESFEVAKELAAKAKAGTDVLVDKVQETNWTEVQYQAKLAVDYSARMAEEGVGPSRLKPTPAVTFLQSSSKRARPVAVQEGQGGAEAL